MQFGGNHNYEILIGIVIFMTEGRSYPCTLNYEDFSPTEVGFEMIKEKILKNPLPVESHSASKMIRILL